MFLIAQDDGVENYLWNNNILLSNNGSTPFERLLGHAPDILARWKAFFKSATFEADFLEQVLRALAFTN